MKFVENVKDSWRWFSMQIAAFGALSVAAWEYIPQEWRDYILQGENARWLVFASYVSIMVARAIKQGSK